MNNTVTKEGSAGETCGRLKRIASVNVFTAC